MVLKSLYQRKILDELVALKQQIIKDYSKNSAEVAIPDHKLQVGTSDDQ